MTDFVWSRLLLAIQSASASRRPGQVLLADMALPVITDAVGARVSITPEMFRQSMLHQSLPRISAGSDQDNTCES